MREFVSNIDELEFDKFNAECLSNHYTKMVGYGKLRAFDGFKYVTCGVKEDGKLVATALVLYHDIWYLASKYCYVCYGYNIDYTNLDLLHFFNQELIKFCKEKFSATFLRIDPDYPLREHLKNGNLKEDGFNNEWLTSAFEKDGFKHLGYNYGYSGNWMSRFTYILDTTSTFEEIKKHIKSYNNSMRKNEMRHLEVYEGTRDDMHILYEAELELAKKNKFKPKPLAYFEALYDSFSEYCHVYVAKANLKLAYRDVKNEYETILNEDTSKLAEVKLNEREKTLKSLEKELKAMEEENYPNIEDKMLGVKFIVQINQKLFNVNMYTFKILPNFRTALALHSKALEECKKRDCTSYDFEGISGSFDPKDAYYGINDFKRSFGGDFIEYPGEFDYIYSPIKYKLFKKIDRYYRIIKRKFYVLLKGWN